MSPLADLLEAHAAGLLQRLRDGLAPGGQAAPQLLDHIPDLLCELGSVLHQSGSAAVRRVAQEFARRHYRRGSDLDALVREYGLVRDCILDFVEQSGTAVSLSELRIFTDFIAYAIAAAVHQYFQPPHQALRPAGEPAHAAAEIPGEPLQSRQRSELLAAHLRHSEEQLHAVIAASGAGMWSFDPAAGDIAVDVRLMTLMGLPADGVLTLDSALAQIWEEDRERVRQAVVGALAGHHGGHYHVEFRINSGATRWVESRGMAAFDAQGKATRLAGAMLDISDRKQAEVEREKLLREVQAAQLRLQGLVQNAPVFLATLRGPTHVFEMVNGPYHRLIGTHRQLIGRSVAESLPEVVPQGFITLLDDVYRTATQYVGNETCIRLDRHDTGELEDVWVNFLYQPTRNVAGEVDGIDAFGFDVTDQVRARQRIEALAAEVRKSEIELRLVIDSIPLLVSFVNAEERYGIVNKSYEDWFGLPQQVMLGQTVESVIGSAAYALLRPQIRRGLAGERFTFEAYAVPYRHGGTRDVKIDFVPHRDAAGEPHGYISILQDITQQRRWAAEGERFARQRSEVLESMGDAFFSMDRDFCIVLVNRRYEQLARKDRQELLGHSFWEVFPAAADPASQYFQAYHRCMQAQLPVQFIDYHPALDLWTDVRVYPTPEGGIAVFFRDVTKEKQAEAMLLRQSEFEQQLIGIVSHDLRNPLNVIQMGAALLRARDTLDARALKTVGRIESSAARAIRLVGDLLDFTQARLGGGIRIAPQPAMLHELTRAVVEEVEAAYPSRQVELRCSGDGQGQWDADRISQVVQNLITNALKYSPEATPVQVVTHGEATFVTLSVHNQGTPIPSEQFASIFQPLQRGTEEIDKAGRSVGLGLYIVQSIVAAHRGRISVTSTADAGTTFTVWLPRMVEA